ncbi:MULTISPECIES: mechanosensitive ion channel family protein [Sphingobacterium]|uniref:Mechanosensitive ion channel domain-containing protein n=1 Tax=Sphingobacterium tenebrionis TaxID=3111775 RepID=A0ABU8I6I0_9SPHI|nr:mechanosensitive ion channel domain-containing protein [Sphingobacterium sp. CZ-2]
MNASLEENKQRIPWSFLLKVFLLGLVTIYYFYFQSELKLDKRLVQFIDGLSAFLIVSVILSILRFLIIFLYNTRHSHRPVRGNFVLGINRLTAILNVVFGIICLMLAFGIDPGKFITSMTIVAMAIAVIFRDYITNMISGLIVMFSEQLSVGDRIRVGEHKGRIIDITFANLVLQDEEDDIVMVPNNMVFTSTFMNLSAHQSSLFSVRFELPLSVSIHIKELEEALKMSLITHPNLKIKNGTIELKVTEIGKDYVKYKIDLYAISNSNRMHRQLENEILKEVLKFESIYIS